MSEESNIEDVAQSETTEASFEGYGIGDADTAEGQSRRAEEDHFSEMIESLHKEVEEMDNLPTEEEAEMGELHRSSELTQEPDKGVLSEIETELKEITEGDDL